MATEAASDIKTDGTDLGLLRRTERDFDVSLDPLAFGLDTVVVTDVSVTHEEGYSEEIGTELAAISGAEQVYYIMSDVDFTVVIRVRNRDHMSEVINRTVAIEAVKETASRFVMGEIKSDSTVLTSDFDDADSG